MTDDIKLAIAQIELVSLTVLNVSDLDRVRLSLYVALVAVMEALKSIDSRLSQLEGEGE